MQGVGLRHKLCLMQYLNMTTNQSLFRHKARIDLLLIPISFVITYLLSSHFNFSEQYVSWSVLHEKDLNIDELPLALLATLSAMAWFSARRYAEIQDLFKLNHQLLHHANRMQEEERRRIAQDLHDDLGQYLNAIRIESTGIMHTENINDEVRVSARRIADHSNHAYNTAKKMMYKLRPVALDDLGLSAALNHLISTWQTPNSATKFELSIAGDIDSLSEHISIDVYRVIQECLTNVARHANAKAVALQVNLSNSILTLSVNDDGIGIQHGSISRGFGLAGMRERIEAHDGKLTIESTLGQGTRISGYLPISHSNQKKIS